MGMDILDPETRDEGPTQPNYSRLRELIRVDIIEGRLASGSRLKIAEIAKRYESSAIPVREALHQLQGEGIVTFEPNRGASVRQIDDPFLRNIHEVRAVLEPYLIRWFVRHRSETELEELIAAQREYDRGAETEGPEQWRHYNQRYHAVCYDGHYNHEALVVAKRHNDLLQALAMRFPMSRSRVLQVCREHWQIIECVRSQDEEAAAAIVAEHVRSAGQDLIERMLAASHSGHRRGHGPGQPQKDS